MDNETQEAIDMLGKGYEPSIEIQPQTVVIRRRGRELSEEVVPAFVKISTGFKAELADIDATALKVWLFIALSINRNTEEAHPSLATLAKACKMGENTVVKAIRYLEASGLLAVNRENRKVNIYRIPEYVSANAKTTSKMEAESTSENDETASENLQTASEKRESASAYERSNQSNQTLNQNNQNSRREKIKLHGIQDAILSGRPVEPEDFPGPDPVEGVLVQLETGLHRNIPRTGQWQDLAKWINRRPGELAGWISWYMADNFRASNAWRMTPEQVRSAWPQAFAPQPINTAKGSRADFLEALKNA